MFTYNWEHKNCSLYEVAGCLLFKEGLLECCSKWKDSFVFRNCWCLWGSIVVHSLLTPPPLPHTQVPEVTSENKPTAEEQPSPERPLTHTPLGSTVNLDSSYSIGELMQQAFHTMQQERGGGRREGGGGAEGTGEGRGKGRDSRAKAPEEQPQLVLPPQQTFSAVTPASQYQLHVM